MVQSYSNRLCKSRSQERPPEYVHTSSRRRWHHRASHSAHDEQCWATGHPRVVRVDLLLRPLEHPFGRHSSLRERSSCVKGSYFQPSDHSRVFMSLPKSRVPRTVRHVIQLVDHSSLWLSLFSMGYDLPNSLSEHITKSKHVLQVGLSQSHY